MAGFAHDVAGGSGNLVITSLQSPDFATGVSGWQVRKDGSAQFNNLTIRGTFYGTDFVLSAAGLFFYNPPAGTLLDQSGQPLLDQSGAPLLDQPGTAAGTLLASIASTAGADGNGNAYEEGFAVYGYGGIGGSVRMATVSGQPLVQLVPGYASYLGSPPALSAATAQNGTSAEQYLAYLTSGYTTGGGAASAVQVGAFSASDDGTVPAYIVFALDYDALAYVLADGTLAAARPGSGGAGYSPETWHAVTYANSWAAVAAGEDLEYQRTPDGFAHLSGRLLVPSGAANPSVIAVLPSGYIPGRAETLPVTVNGGSPYTATPMVLIIGTDGSVSLYGAATAGDTLNIQGRYPLAA